MPTVELLVWEHKLLRAHVNILEASLSKERGAWGLLREVSASLAEALGEHHRREAECAALCRSALRAAGSNGLASHHGLECDMMLAINRFFLEQPTCLVDRVRPRLREFIEAVRSRMDQQEAEIFPILKAARASSLANRPRGQAGPVSPTRAITLHDALGNALDDYAMGEWLDDGL